MANIEELLARAKKLASEKKVNPVAAINTLASLKANFELANVPNASVKEIVNTGSLAPGIHHVDMNNLKPDYSGRTSTGMNGEEIELNDEQLEAAERGGNGEPIVVIGPAGSGKTTTQRALCLRLIESGHAGTINDTEGHKYLVSGRPGIVVVSYTRRATNNIRKILPPQLQQNCMTIHKLLEYEPFVDDEVDSSGFPVLDESGKQKKVQGFKPMRDASIPLPRDIKVIVIEEAGMVSLELHEKLMDAITHEVQIIYLGDIFQLTPPMGDGILAYKMLELKVVELKQVYRNKSYILDFATDIKDGIVIKAPAVKLAGELHPRFPVLDAMKDKTNGAIELRTFRTRVDPISTNALIRQSLIKELKAGNYNPADDIILCPFDRELSKTTKEELVSCVNINKAIAGFLSSSKNIPVQEIIAGRNVHYYAVGDKVLYDKRDAFIRAIRPNPKYLGKSTRKANVHIDRWGNNSHEDDQYNTFDDFNSVDVLSRLDDVFNLTVEDVTNQASHVVTIAYDDEDSDWTEELSTAGAINKLMFGYAITVYKSQGAEWEKVFCVFHHSHSRMISNECLYTAVTRARKQLVIYCEPDTFTSGVLNREIKGKTLADKAKHMMKKQTERQNPLAFAALSKLK